jgi:hypothetical protein
MSVQTTYPSSLTARIAGQLADSGDHDIVAMVNGEATDSIPFGRCVMTGSTTDPNSMKIVAAETSIVWGILLHSYAYDPTYDLDSTGLKAGRPGQVLRKGRCIVLLEDAVTIGQRGWVRGAAGAAGGELVGGILPADDGSDTVDCTNQIVFLEAGSAGDLVMVEVDFTNSPT